MNSPVSILKLGTHVNRVVIVGLSCVLRGFFPEFSSFPQHLELSCDPWSDIMTWVVRQLPEEA